jgi:hypothetical protein
VTKDAAQRRSWTFYEAVIIGALFFQILSRDRFCSPLSFYR